MFTHSPPEYGRQPLRRVLAVEAGVSDRELSGPQWRRLLQGVHSWSRADVADPQVRIRAVASVLPVEAAIGGWAAAHLLGASDLDGRGFDGHTLLPVPVCLQPVTQMRPRRQVHPLRSSLTSDDVVHVEGIPITSPRRTCFDLMRAPTLPGGPTTPLRGLEEAVVGVDAMLRAGLVSVANVREYVAQRPRWRGVPQARQALDLADARARSCPESRFRVLWVVEAGLPRPQVNQRVCDLDGSLLGLPDLLDVEAGLVGEYDGGQHRELQQHTADNIREENFEDHGLIVVRAGRLDLTRMRARMVARLRSARLRGLQRDRGRDRWLLIRD